MFLFSRLSSSAPEVLTTLLIFSLSSGVLGGILIYMDSAAPFVLADMTADVPIDMQVSFATPFYGQSNITIEDVRENVAEQDFVTATEHVTFANVYVFNEIDYSETWMGFLGVNKTAFASFSDAIDVDPLSLDYDNSSCLIEESFLVNQGLIIGGNYTIQVSVYANVNGSWQEVEIERTFTIVGTFISHIYMYQARWGQPEVTYLRMISTPEAIASTFSILGHESYYGMEDKIWVKFDHAIIAKSDAVTVVDSLLNVKRRIEQDNLPLVFVDSSNFELLEAVNEFSSWSISMRAIALAFSIPSIIMGAMLIQYNSRLLSDAQRKDVGTLKTRGASGFQAASWVLSNALATGIIGSLGAIITGTLAALLSGTVRELMVFNLASISGFTILLQPFAVLAVFLFSFTIGIIVALPSAVKALLMTASEAHSTIKREILTDSEKMGTSTIDLIAIGISGWLLIPMMTMLAYSGLTTFGSIAFAGIIIPLLGIFLFSFTRLLSRPTASVKGHVLGRIRRPSLVVGSQLMSRTIKLFKKSETMGTMFIAMVFTAGLFASISATTGNTHMKEIFMFQTGADIAIDINPALTNVTTDLVEDIAAIEGVIHVSPMLITTGYVQYWSAYYFGGGTNYNRTITVFGVEPESWINAAFWLNYFTLYNLPTVSIPLLSDRSGNGINVLTSFKPIQKYTIDSIGSRFPVYSNQIDLQLISEGGNNITECTIVDLMNSQVSDQSIGYSYVPGEPSARDFLVADLNYVHSCLNTTHISKFYIDIETGANYTKVMEEIYSIAPNSFTNMESALSYIDAVLDSRATQSIYGTYTLNVLFSIIYLTIGMSIVSIVRVRGLRKQFSVLRALGAPNRSIIVASLVETGIGVLIAAAIGGMIGVSLAFILKNVPLLYMGVYTSGLWSRLPVQLVIPISLVTAIVGISVAVALIATYYIVERTLKLNIAEEIQYNE
ncbi:hypothetical protein EU527_17510 [Candidatus Thorarchaeota archaeon]|nr:MAG: hypothetical protein EU527_17510 [Candidatus Thorarchaeota archaeon]